MDLLDHGARTGTAGFVLSRVLLMPPNQALAENFGTPQMRATWPLHDEYSAPAVDRLEPDPYEALPRDHTTMFGRRPPLVPLHESAWRSDVTDRAELRAELASAYEGANFTSLPTPVDDHVGYQVAYLAHLATTVGRAAAAGDGETLRGAASTAVRFRAAHTDRVIEPILQGITEHAKTNLYRAVPGLLRGFLAEHHRLCAAALDHQPA